MNSPNRAQQKAASFPVLSLTATAYTKGQLVAQQAAQLAFAGRSNVGKSSLINALAGRKSLAKISATPGKTRSINYYSLDGAEKYIVDLPGYGYAKCSHAERNKWAEILTYYFTNTPGLRALVLLLDSRLPPQKADVDLVTYALSLSLRVMPVLTKADKCNTRELASCKRAWNAFFPEDAIFVTSAAGKKGLEDLWAAMLHRLE